MNEKAKKVPMDPKVFWPSLIAIAAISIPMAIDPVGGSKIASKIFSFITGKFGWLYLWFCVFCFVACLYLIFSKYGNIKLGDPNDKPEYNYFSYFAMIFCAAYSVSVMLWGFIEGSYYWAKPAFHWIAPKSIEAAEMASAYVMFHRGFTAWALYALPVIPVAYVLYVRKEPYLRMSRACRGILGSWVDGWGGKVIDVMLIFGIIGGGATSLGLAVPLLSKLISVLTGLTDGYMLQIAVLVVWTGGFCFSVWRGLDKGIKTFSNINIYLMFILLFFVLFFGPTLYIIKSMTTAIGMCLTNLPLMHLWMDPIVNSGFPENWTVFYWAWWVAYTPMMGMFVARISRGRTVKQVILTQLVGVTAAAWLVYGVWGNYTMNLNVQGIVDVGKILAEQGQPQAIMAILGTLPAPTFALINYAICCFIFMITTLDSCAYVLASMCSLEIRGDQQPARWNRVTWAIVTGFVPIGLLATGGLKGVQTASLLVALPMIPILLIMFASTYKWMNLDFKGIYSSEQYSLKHMPDGNVTMQISRNNETLDM